MIKKLHFYIFVILCSSFITIQASTMDKTILKATIEEITPDVLFVSQADTDEVTGLLLTPETIILSKDIYQKCSIEHLHKDMIVNVEYEIINDILTAVTIEILKGNGDYTSFISRIASGKLAEVKVDRYIILEDVSMNDKKYDQILVYIDKYTKVRTSTADTHITIKNLCKGNDLKIITSGILTSSKVPQTVGVEIILIVH